MFRVYGFRVVGREIGENGLGLSRGGKGKRAKGSGVRVYGRGFELLRMLMGLCDWCLRSRC